MYFDHDGSVDDFAALSLLAKAKCTMDAVFVTDGDCYAEPAAIVSKRILALCGGPDIPVFKNHSTLPNPFPSEWRQDSLRIMESPPLRNIGHNDVEGMGGEDAMNNMLNRATSPVYLVSTSPLTATARVLTQQPQWAANVSGILWMGGALGVPGNVDAPNHDGTAEWNSYADPHAVKNVLASGVPVTLCPLDVCHKVPVDAKFVDRLNDQRCIPIFDVLSTMYSLVCFREYFAWDLLTAAYYIWPELFSLRETRVSVTQSGISRGRITIDDHGTAVTVVDDVDLAALYRAIIDTWRS